MALSRSVVGEEGQQYLRALDRSNSIKVPLASTLLFASASTRPIRPQIKEGPAGQHPANDAEPFRKELDNASLSMIFVLTEDLVRCFELFLQTPYLPNQLPLPTFLVFNSQVPFL